MVGRVSAALLELHQFQVIPKNYRDHAQVRTPSTGVCLVPEGFAQLIGQLAPARRNTWNSVPTTQWDRFKALYGMGQTLLYSPISEGAGPKRLQSVATIKKQWRCTTRVLVCSFFRKHVTDSTGREWRDPWDGNVGCLTLLLHEAANALG